MDWLTSTLSPAGAPLAVIDVSGWANFGFQFLKVLLGFSLIVFVHELGHFLAAKWCGVRVDRFAVGFGPRLFGWRAGEGFTLGSRPNYTPPELATRGFGETDYCFQALPLGGYVKMLGENDFDYDEKTGEVKLSNDPRAFPNKPVGARMIVVSAGVIFNLLFAALALMSVFMVGHRLVAPVIGYVEPGGPADLAGVRPGDVVAAINGQKVDYWQDVAVREALSSKPLSLRIQRDGAELSRPIVVNAVSDPILKRPSVGIDPTFQYFAESDWPPVGDQPAVKKGDLLVAIDDQPIQSLLDLEAGLLRSRGRVAKLRVARPSSVKDEDSPRAELDAWIQPRFEMQPVNQNAEANRDANEETSANLLGFVPRAAVSKVVKGRAADRAGMREGDVIVRIDRISAPTEAEILKQIELSDFKPITFEVLRGDETKSLTITPQPAQRFRLFGASRPQIGIARPFDSELRRVVIARVEPNSPAASAGVMAGAELVAIDGAEVTNWEQVYQAFAQNAGRRLPLRYRAEGQVLETTIEVPRTIVSELALPTDAMILAVADKQFVKGAGERNVRVNSPGGLNSALRAEVGNRVTIRYADRLGQGEERTAEIDVTPALSFAWERGVRWALPGTVTQQPVMWPVSAGGNPLRALWMGLKVTVQQVSMTYQTMQQVANQRVSTENLSGPIGIFNIAIEQAQSGWRQLLLFFAFLSVNLAVLNFLPLPVLDGGLMVLLILEKIRGKALALKTQTQITLAGLALIGIIFVVVTFQDIAKLVN